MSGHTLSNYNHKNPYWFISNDLKAYRIKMCTWNECGKSQDVEGTKYSSVVFLWKGDFFIQRRKFLLLWCSISSRGLKDLGPMSLWENFVSNYWNWILWILLKNAPLHTTHNQDSVSFVICYLCIWIRHYKCRTLKVPYYSGMCTCYQTSKQRNDVLSLYEVSDPIVQEITGKEWNPANHFI